MKVCLFGVHRIVRPGIKTARRCWWVLPVVAAAVILAAACAGGDGRGAIQTPADASTISVVTTLYPLEYFARRVGGERVSVVNLIPPGVEAHSFEPSPGDIRKLEGADMVMYMGPAFEPWFARAQEAMDGGPRLAIVFGVGVADPHLWLDPLKAMEMVSSISTSLSQIDGDGEQLYDANAEALLGELEALHQRYLDGLEGCRLNLFVTSHAAFGHLASRYGLEQLPISGLSPEAEPGPRDLASMSDSLREMGVKHILVEPVASTSFARTLAREVGADLLPLHPLESLTPDEANRGEDYFTIMDSNLESLRLALECER